MRRKLLLPLLLLVVCAAGGYVTWSKKPRPAPKVAPAPDVQVGWLTITDEGRPKGRISEAKPDEKTAWVAAAYRLMPDRRLLYAAAELDRMATGRERSPMTIRFVSGAWQVTLGGVSLGTLPEIPTFDDGVAFLGPLAKRAASPLSRGGARVAVPADVTRDVTTGPAPKVVARLRELDALWKASHDRETLRLGAHGLLWLRAQGLDRLQMTDSLLGHTWALVALARALGPAGLDAENALLARELGYDDAAARAASGLPAADPIRLYVEYDRKGLESVARASHDTVSRALLIRLDAEGRCCGEPPELPAPAWGADGAIPLLALEANREAFGTGRRSAEALARQVFSDVRSSCFPASSIPGSALTERLGARFPRILSFLAERPPQADLRAFEALTSRRARGVAGELLDRESVSSFYRANLYSALYEEARFLFDGISDTEGARHLGESILDPPEGPGSELKRWILDRVALRADRLKGMPALAKDLATFRRIGLEPLSLYRNLTLENRKHVWDLEQRRPIPGYFAGLDTRPENLEEAWSVAYWNLDDLALTERTLRPSVRATRSPASLAAITLAWLEQDLAGLSAIVSDVRLTSRARGWALEKLVEVRAASPARRRDAALAILRTDGRSTSAQDTLLAALHDGGELPDSLEATRAWLLDHGVSPEVDWVHDSHLATKLAELLLKGGRKAAGLVAAEEAASSGRSEGVDQRARALAENGRLAEALEVATANQQRYEHEGKRYGRVAEIRWRMGQPTEAAAALQEAKPRLGGGDFRSIAEYFADVFEKGPADDAEQAYRALFPLGFDVPIYPGAIPIELDRRGATDLAIRLTDALGQAAARHVNAVTYDLYAYRMRVRRDGPASAFAWFQGRIPKWDRMNSFMLHLYGEQEHDLLFAIYPKDAPPVRNDVLIALRAASLVESRKDEDPERRAQLTSTLAGRPRDESFAQLSRYLLGLISREELLSGMKVKGNQCEIAWTLGLVEARRGRYEEANGWLQAAVDLGIDRGVESFPPLDYAWELLRRWTGRHQLLSAVAKDGLM